MLQNKTQFICTLTLGSGNAGEEFKNFIFTSLSYSYDKHYIALEDKVQVPIVPYIIWKYIVSS